MTVDRTVRNGAVKIGGRTYRPVEHHMPYDGRLDGVRFAFGVYSYTTRFVSLHSVAESIHSEDDNAVMEEPHCIDGAYPWRWWFAQESELDELERAASVAATAAAKGAGR